MENQTGENSSTCIQSLVCEACWSGPFAFQSFQQAIVRKPYSEDCTDGFSYTTTWEKIQNSAAERCNWCKLLAYVARNGPRTGIVSVRLCVQLVPQKYENALRLSIDSDHFYFDIYADHGGEAAKYLGTGTGDIGRRSVPFPDYKAASEWIIKCADHEFCQKQVDVPLPTRVIDCSQPKEPRLLITEGRPGYYAALSYVWGRGEKQPQRTTTANVDTYVQGINVPLPKTIVDAIVVTQKLGLTYLWVDSLCILQDSDKDKENEIAQMRTIYGNACVTIAAASAYGVNEGFLEDQRPTIRLPFQYTVGNVESMLVSRLGEVFIDWRTLGIETGGLHNRAWCFQESILSPRQLIFSSPFLLFACRTFTDFATADYNVNTKPEPSKIHLLFPNKPYVPSKDQLSDLRTLWNEWLGQYSGRGMSRPSDKLVAIAGVVEAFHRVWGGRYIAGLWEQTLIEDLLWSLDYSASDSPLLERPKYRAPSWSWAAIDGEIKPHRDHFTDIPSIAYKCEILECKTTLKCEDDPWGQVTNGILRISAKMKKVRWDPIKRNLIEPGSLWNGTGGTSADPRTTSQDQVCPDSAEEVTKSIGDVWLVLLQLGTTLQEEPWAEDEPGTHGLFVVPAGNHCYRRVGILRSFRVPDWYETTPREEITIV